MDKALPSECWVTVEGEGWNKGASSLPRLPQNLDFLYVQWASGLRDQLMI